jgi:RimJ/RimL family protein N-acetyltransferase
MATFYLETERLVMVQTPLDVLQTRLEREEFTLDVPVGAQTLGVHFPADWPGDALVMLPGMIARYASEPEHCTWGGMILERATRTAVGSMGVKGEPDEHGAIEFGYGLVPAAWGRGYATEMARAFVAWLLAQPAVTRVTAETRTDNAASMRVLEKCGFRRCGERLDEEDGPLFQWEKTR